jgi:hypothetical protein
MADTGEIQGVPTAAGVSTVVVAVSDSSPSPQSTVKTYSLTIMVGGDLAIATTSLAKGRVGVPYSATLVAAGGTGSRTWWVVGGRLPAGLMLDAQTGQITGTPLAASDSSVTFEVRDAAPQIQPARVTLTISITN